MSFARRISKWGIASLLLFLVERAIAEYELHLDSQRAPVLFGDWSAANQFCGVVQLAAVVCGVVAVRRQSYWWLLTVLPAAWLSLVCFFGF